MGPPLMLLLLLFGAATVTQAANEPLSCHLNGRKVPHGSPVWTVAHKCSQFVCQNGFPMPEALQGVTSGCCDFNTVLYRPGDVYVDGCVKMTCRASKWTPLGQVEHRCKHCEVFNDPHFWSFDRHRFDYHEECTYALAQDEYSLRPNFGIFTEFRKCFAAPTCVHKTVFQDNRKLLIQIGATGLTSPNIYDLLINNKKFTIPADTFAHRLKVNDKEQDVLVWRQGLCVRILGSNGLLLQHCKNRVDIWAHSKLKDKVHGLCGSPDDDINNDFISRKKIEYPVEGFAPPNFADSWKTLTQSQRGCNVRVRKRALKKTPEQIVGECWNNFDEWSKISDRCNEVIDGVTSNGHTITDGLYSVLKDACTFDLCMIKSTAANPEDVMRKWLAEVKQMTEERVFLEAMVDGCDPVKGECQEVGGDGNGNQPQPGNGNPRVCTGRGCLIDLLFNPADYEGKIVRLARST